MVVTEERKAAWAAHKREWYANLSPEQKAAYNVKQRERKANLSPEQKAARAAYMREYDANRTSEQKAARAARILANRTPEQKEAKAAYDREWRDQLSPERKAAKSEKQAQELRDPKHWAKCRLAKIKGRANKKGLDFNLEERDLEPPCFCPVLGIPLYMGLAAISHNSIHVDRIDNSKGYVKGNVKLISGRANSLKNDGTIKELEAILKYMREHQ